MPMPDDSMALLSELQARYAIMSHDSTGPFLLRNQRGAAEWARTHVAMRKKRAADPRRPSRQA